MDPDSYLRAFRAASEAPAGSKSRNLAAVYAKLGAGDRDVTAEDDAPEPPVVRGRWAAGVFFIKSIGLSVAIGATGLGLMTVAMRAWNEHRPPPPRTEVVLRPPPPVRSVQRPKPAEPPVAAVPSPVVDFAPEPALPAPVVPKTTTRRTAGRSAPQSPETADRLAEELALVRSIEQAMDRGDERAALAGIAEHRRRFPNGSLAPERDAWADEIRERSETDSSSSREGEGR